MSKFRVLITISAILTFISLSVIIIVVNEDDRKTSLEGIKLATFSNTNKYKIKGEI